jgi:hypothetical protein
VISRARGGSGQQSRRGLRPNPEKGARPVEECTLLHRADGHRYAWRSAFPPPAEAGGHQRGRFG